jgi:hypothetical protein
MLGHGSLAVTNRYLHPGVAKLGKMMDVRNESRKVTEDATQSSELVTICKLDQSSRC